MVEAELGKVIKLILQWLLKWKRKGPQMLMCLRFERSIKNPSSLRKWEDAQGSIHATVPSMFTQEATRVKWRLEHFYLKLVSKYIFMCCLFILKEFNYLLFYVSHMFYSVFFFLFKRDVYKDGAFMWCRLGCAAELLCSDALQDGYAWLLTLCARQRANSDQ